MSGNEASNATNANDSAANRGGKEAEQINGQTTTMTTMTTATSVRTNGSDVPTIPTKPIRHTILAKRDGQSPYMATTQPIDRNGSAPVANATETDEIEFLLDEIKDLDVPACRTDSEQDFEIDGSRVDLDLSLHLDSPIDTSWYYFSILFFSPSLFLI